MKYNQPFGITDPNAPYINGNPETGTMGSIPPAASIEYPQREIVNLIKGTLITPDNADLSQLAKAIQSGQLFYGLDTGSANHMVTALVPTPNQLVPGMFAFVSAAADNTGASDFTTNGISTGIVRPDGTALIMGDIKRGQMTLLVYDGTHWQMPAPAGGGGSSVLKLLTQPIDLYVNGSIGNDANDGIDGTVFHAFKTVQHAVDVAQSFMPSQYGVTIHIADGVYNEAVLTTDVGTPTINIIGNTANPEAVQIGNSGADTYPKFCGLGVRGANVMNVEGVCCRSGTATTDNPGAFIAMFGAVMNMRNTASLFGQGAAIEAFGSATINFYGNHKFAGGGGGGMYAWQGGNIYVTGQLPITFTWVPGVSYSGGNGSVFFAIDNGQILFQSHAAVMAGPAPAGYRYNATLGGVIDTMGGGPNYLPGTLAGVLSNGGLYG